MRDVSATVSAEGFKQFRLNAKQELALAYMTDPVARHTLLLGGGRCLGGASLVDTSLGTFSLKSLYDKATAFVVKSLSNTADTVYVPAEAPFLKGVARLKHVVLGNGKWFDAHPIHRVIGLRNGKFCWIFVRDLVVGDEVLSSFFDSKCVSSHQESILEPDPLASFSDAQRCSQKSQGSRSCCPKCRRFCGEQLLQAPIRGQDVLASQVDVSKCKPGGCFCQKPRSGVEPSCTLLTFFRHLSKSHVARPAGQIHEAEHPFCAANDERIRHLFHGAQRQQHTVSNFFQNCTSQSLLADALPNKKQKPSEFLLKLSRIAMRRLPVASVQSPAQPEQPEDLRDVCTSGVSFQDDRQSDICLGHESMFFALSSKNPFGLTTVLESSYKEEPEEYYDFAVPSTAIYSAGGCFHHNSGKTVLCVWSNIIRALTYPRSRHLSLRLHRVTAEKYLWKQTLMDVIEKCFRGIAFEYNHSKMILTLPNGSSYWFGGLDEGEKSDGLLGSDWNTVHFDEANEMLPDGMQKARTRLSLKTRSEDGTRFCINRSFATVNPTYKTHHLYRTYVERFDIFNGLPMPPSQSSMYNWFRINPCDNLENLGEDYIRELESHSAENRRRFLEGEWSEESKDALFKSADINRSRVKTFEELAAINFDKIVVGVDPAVTSGAKADMTGIIVVGWTRPKVGDRRSSGQYYLLDDRSLRGTPDEWAQAVYDAYTHWKADLVVGEANNGGDLVEKNIRSVSRVIPFKKVWASRGKLIRAQPVAALCAQGDLHVGVSLPELEGEMIGWNPDSGEPSPNRLDAMVWGVSEVMGATMKQVRIVGAI